MSVLAACTGLRAQGYMHSAGMLPLTQTYHIVLLQPETLISFPVLNVGNTLPPQVELLWGGGKAKPQQHSAKGVTGKLSK